MPGDITEDKAFAKDLLALRRLLFDEPRDDRVAAIVSAAYIEKWLVDLIAEFFPGMDDDPALKKDMFNDVSGMAGTLGRKLSMARALNAIAQETFADGTTIAKIRNKFAHNLEVTSFDHPKVRDLTDAMWRRWNDEVTNIDWHQQTAAWSRADRFRYVAQATCVAIMHHHIKEYPFRYSDAELGSLMTSGRLSSLDKLSKPPSRQE